MTQLPAAEAGPLQAELCSDLLSDSPSAKWPLLGRAQAAEAVKDGRTAAEALEALVASDPQPPTGLWEEEPYLRQRPVVVINTGSTTNGASAACHDQRPPHCPQ